MKVNRKNGALPKGTQYYWERMRELSATKGEFTAADIYALTNGVIRATIKRYIFNCEYYGHIVRLNDAPKGRIREPARFKIAIDASAAPVLPKIGDRDARSNHGDVNRQIWTAIRSLKNFGLRELQVVASTDELVVNRAAVVRYVRNLKNAGLVLVVENNGPYKPWVYRLRPAANTGPKPPKVMRDGVLDQNVGQLHEYCRVAA